jgi:hypothetical protein
MQRALVDRVTIDIITRIIGFYFSSYAIRTIFFDSLLSERKIMAG